jgi:hypothetical protein
MKLRSIQFVFLGMIAACAAGDDSDTPTGAEESALGSVLSFSDFESGVATGWTPIAGTWAVCQPPGASHEYCESDTTGTPSLSVTGSATWSDYSIDAAALSTDSSVGWLELVGRFHDAANYYELQVRGTTWAIRRLSANAWTVLASGSFSFASNTYYRLKLEMVGTKLTASTSADKGATWQTLGSATDATFSDGKAGVKSKYAVARFDKITVTSLSQTPPPPTGTLPHFGHVVFVVLENHSVGDIIGNPLMPYFNGLANQYASATQYWPNFHPSQPNYFALTTGDVFYQTTTLPAGTPNVVKTLLGASKSWKSYFETLTTSANVFRYFPEVANSSAQLAKLVTVTQFDADVAAGTLPAYSMVHPSTSHSGHSCAAGDLTCPGFKVADDWLRTHLAPYLASPGFTSNNDLLIIGFDEGSLSLTGCAGTKTIPISPAVAALHQVWECGDHAPMILIGPSVKPGFKSTTIYHDEAILRLMLEGLGVTSNLPGASASAPRMTEFFQ